MSYFDRMRMSGLAALIAGLAFGLSACSSTAQPGETKGVSLSSSSTSAGIDSLSLRAQSVWSAYFSAYTDALADPEVSSSKIRPYVTNAEYKVVAAGIDEFQNGGFKLKGLSASRNFRVTEASKSNQRVTAFVCLDNAKSRIVNEANKDVTPKSRPSESTLRLTFLNEGGHLLLDEDETWKSESAC